MGNYATNSDLIARFESEADLSFLTDSTDTLTADTSVLAEVLNDAEGTIDSYLAKRYKVPVRVSSDVVLAARLKSLTLDLAVWKLLVRGDIASAVKEKMYDQAIEYLKGVAAGSIMLPAAAALDPGDANDPVAEWGIGGAVVSGTSQRVFTREDQGRL